MAGLFGNFVVPDFLATESDYITWVGSDAEPVNLTGLLRTASAMVLSASASSYYAVDPDTGLATDPVVAKALTQATCIQAAALGALGIDPLLGGVVTAGVVAEKAIGSARLRYADSAEASAARAKALTDLVPEARLKLAQNNLLDSNVWMYG